MDFDFAHVAVPFRMQPGLRKLADGAPQLTPLQPGSALWREKKAVVDAGFSRLCVPGFDPAPAIESIAGRAVLERLGGRSGPENPLELAFEEDFAVLDARDGTLPWLCVCVPSHWAPEDKLGLPFTAVHAPVADNALLLASAKQLVGLVTAEGGRWERFVWTVSPSSRYDQHPKRHAREPWPDATEPEAFAQRCFLRTERQTFFPVPGHPQAVFTIRVMRQPLSQAVDTAAKAQRLHDSLASMSEAVLAYKGLAGARTPLLAWLQAKAGA